MLTVTKREALEPSQSQTALFTGADHNADVSFFWVDTPPGGGPEFHWHPYAETWVVLHGQVLIETQDDKLNASPGDIVTVSAETVHRFRNHGDDQLRMLCIHPSPKIIEEFV
jgi:mannose-6-phosphate isomerase-like protein (cupin superfamily)